MKKNLLKFCVAALAMVALAACGDKNKPEEQDARNAFVGTYTYEATGGVDFSGIRVPLNQRGTLQISKVGDKDQVIITGYNDTINATVSGNTLSLESTFYSMTIGGVRCDMDFVYDKAVLTDNILSWTSNIDAIGQYQNLPLKGTGTVTVVATKQ